MSDIKIYVASPFGFFEAGREFLNSKIIPAIRRVGYEVLDPWKLSEDVVASVEDLPPGEDRRIGCMEANRIISQNNAAAIRESTGLCAVLDGADVDSGTASEIGFAAAFGKPILGYRSDFRQAGENDGAVVNSQVEYFIRLNGGRIISSVDALEGALRLLFEKAE